MIAMIGIKAIYSLRVWTKLRVLIEAIWICLEEMFEFLVLSFCLITMFSSMHYIVEEKEFT